MNSGFSWNDARIEQLQDLWSQGLSGGAIARALGGGCSRNAVIGKVHRLGLQSRPARLGADRKPAAAPRSHNRVVKVKPSVRKLEIFKASHPDPLRLEGGALIGTADLRNCHCRWPHGDVGADDFHYCGHPKAANSSWCEFHQVRAGASSQPPSPEAGSLGGQAKAAKADASFLRMFG